METKRLYRSSSHSILFGVCGGIADYFQLDPTLVRVGWVILSIFTAGFPGILAYIVCFFIIPLEP